MKKLFIAGVILILTTDIACAQIPARLIRIAQGGPQKIGEQVNRPNQQKQQQRQQLARPTDRGNAANRPGPAAIENLVEGYYISRFPVAVQLSDEQFVKVLPVLRQSIREQRDLGQSRRRAINQLIQMTQRDEPEENLKRMVAELDKIEEDYQANLQRLFSSVDPHLTPYQQARFRVFQDMFNQEMRQMLNQIRNPAPPPGPGKD